jgi:predicted N-acetyltransferase YhbS
MLNQRKNLFLTNPSRGALISCVRNYKPEDNEAVIALYKIGKLFGGQFDEARDSREKLSDATKCDPESILVYEESDHIIGTISLIENGRVAWLFRFAVQETDKTAEVAQALYEKAREVLKSRGYSQILVYSDPDNENLNQRYTALGMTEGNLFRCFWEEV